MKRSTFVIGSAMIIIGFVLHQFGWSAELHEETILGIWLNEFITTIGTDSTAIIVFLQFFGGLLAIFGLIICISGIASSNQVRYSDQETRQRIKTSICKFCGAELEKDLIFCSKCKKSQS